MPFEPDVIVTASEGLGVLLVAEVKISLTDKSQAEEQLKRYMVGMRCPVGLLVTPERLWIYNDSYSVPGLASVECVGEFPLFGLRVLQLDADVFPRQPAFALEQAVQRWLEGLSTESERQKLPPALREALEEYVVPALNEGQVRAAGPRAEPASSIAR
jgi:hypothetical protein